MAEWKGLSVVFSVKSTNDRWLCCNTGCEHSFV
jgi:hypothetical protein